MTDGSEGSAGERADFGTEPLRVLILAPLANDARLTADALVSAGLSATPCADFLTFYGEAKSGAGAWLLAEEALDTPNAAALVGILSAQPSWSDIPIVIITTGGSEATSARRHRLAAFGPGGNVSLVERPFRPATLLSVLETALRARRRQYEVRDLLEQSRADSDALRESRLFLRSAIDALASHIAVLSPDGKIIEVNAAWKSFADTNGYAGRNYGLGTSYLGVLDQHPGCGDDGEAATGIRDVVCGRLPRFQLEYPCHSSTEQRWYLMSVTPFYGENPARVVVSHENITARMLANHALRDADRRKDEFLAMLAHELRNPLASVTNAATLLQEGADDGEHAWAADVIARQSGQLGRLVDDLLDVSRITRGKIDLRKSLIDAARCLENACEAVAPMVAGRSHTLTADFPRAGLWLEADPTRLEQILSNLLANAAKYTEPHGHIWVSARRETNEIVVAIRDNGAGISRKKIPEMFELFAQGERSAARSEGGLGIGLTVVRGLCELHGGSVIAESEGLGRGTTFTVRLPAVDAQDAPSATRGKPVAIAPAEGLRILIVDDNRDTAAGLGKLLSRSGYRIILAHDGEEALERARAELPAAVLLDIGLPGMDGYEVARHLRRESCGADALIVALSGYGQEEDRQQSRAAGFDGHMVKPVDVAELRTLLGTKLSPP